jgi:hypothetical protein
MSYKIIQFQVDGRQMLTQEGNTDLSTRHKVDRSNGVKVLDQASLKARTSGIRTATQ